MITSACATPNHYVRVATATSAELEAAQKKPCVWYEFQPGDVVPFHFGFFGFLEGGAEVAPLRAKHRFYLVANGSSFVGPAASQSLIAVLPREDCAGAQVGWLHYLGESANPESELEGLMKR